MKPDVTSEEYLLRRKAIYSLKIEHERWALQEGLIGPGSPADYKSVPGQSRKERLADWERVLLGIERELSKLSLPHLVQAREPQRQDALR